MGSRSVTTIHRTRPAGSHLKANLVADIAEIIRQSHPREIHVTNEADTHRDHRAAFWFVRDAARATAYGGPIFTYVAHGQGPAEPPSRRLVLTKEELETKRALWWITRPAPRRSTISSPLNTRSRRNCFGATGPGRPRRRRSDCPWGARKVDFAPSMKTIPPTGFLAARILRIAATGLLAAGLLAATGLRAAEPVVVPLWPGAAPGDTGIAGEELVKVYESAILKGPTKLITNVTKPTLTIYSPPKDWNTGTAMLICPGGGYHDLFWELEGEEVAAWLNAHGMTGIILKYRCPRRAGDVKGEPPLGPQLDAQRAVSLVRSRAAEWGIDPSVSAWSASRRADISRWPPRRASRSGSMSRSTPSTP